MTISSQTRKAGPFPGDGIAVSFPFDFKVFAASDVLVVRADGAGVETTLVLSSDYSVSLNSNQNNDPGGTVTLLGGPLAVGLTLVVSSKLAILQPTDLSNQGGFYPSVLNDALDRATIQIQQLAEQLDRSVKVPITSSVDPDGLIADVIQAEADATAAAAAAAASLDAFDDRYLGSKTSDPTVDNDGQALIVGALYWNTVGNAMRVWNGTAWQDVAQGVSLPFQVFNGTGAQTAFTLSSPPGSLGSVEVFISGVRQVPTTNYTLSGTTLTFVTAPPAGTGNIFVRWISTQAINVPADGSVTFAKMQNIATARLLGRVAAGSGLVEELTGAQAQSLQPIQQTRVDVASAATVNLTTGATNTDHVNITGTTTITGFTVAAGRLVFVRFAGALTLTNNASIVTQTGANILTQAGDTCILRATAANTVEVLAYREGRWAAAEGSAPLAAARAWVNFNGTGTVAIRRAFNVTSITDNGVGDYTVNFTTAMPDADYAAAGMGVNSVNNHTVALSTTSPTSSACRLNVFQSGGALGDSSFVNFAAFR